MSELNHLNKQQKQELLNLLEEQRRRKAHKSIIEYCKQIIIPGAPINENEDCEEFYPDLITPAKHHEIILDTAQKLIERKLVYQNEIVDLLIILAPPGSAKSTYASVVIPTWFMGAYRNHNIITASYASDLAAKFGRRCRSICKSDEFQKIFKTSLTQGNTAADDWSINNGSTYMCGGLLSGITGNRADGLIIDDPFKNREEANSETIRKKVKDEWRDTCQTRMKPNGWKIIINTRWHEADLSGSILPKDYKGDSGFFETRTGNYCYVLNFQAECQLNTDPLGRKKGEYLWLDWFTPKFWEKIKKEMRGYSWSALYQGIPTPDEGTFFNRDNFKRFRLGEEPKRLNKFICGDYAVTEQIDQNDPDFSEIGVGGFDEIEDLWLIDWWKGQTTTDVWMSELIRLVRLHNPLASVAEGGIIEKSIKPFLNKEMQKESCYFRQEYITSNKDKQAKCRSFQGMSCQGKIWIPLCDWGDKLIEQLVGFPNARYDDGVDVCGLFGRILDQTFAPAKPEEPQKIRRHDYGLEDDEIENSWKIA